ncbi:hypothetical protein [Ktedonospora formicarum]|uniref:Uncharacterized protein n=1 Tax=Ktedonospora formicarum TaxID=2778364 RepID=A0A8J3I4D0_9CHLR|nr:hypothetical protein [Ktedonospora formicarum]GHO45967.1 hypothetical protein KSX_41300 [Ktedonospora formicarum]
MYNPNQYPQQQSYPPNQYPPQQAYPPYNGQYPQVPGSAPNQYPPQQLPYGQHSSKGSEQRRVYRRQRRANQFQIRMGALSCIAIVAGFYLIVSGHAKNLTAAFGLIGGGILILLIVVLSLLPRR